MLCGQISLKSLWFQTQMETSLHNGTTGLAPTSDPWPWLGFGVAHPCGLADTTGWACLGRMLWVFFLRSSSMHPALAAAWAEWGLVLCHILSAAEWQAEDSGGFHSRECSASAKPSCSTAHEWCFLPSVTGKETLSHPSKWWPCLNKTWLCHLLSESQQQK